MFLKYFKPEDVLSLTVSRPRHIEHTHVYIPRDTDMISSFANSTDQSNPPAVTYAVERKSQTESDSCRS